MSDIVTAKPFDEILAGMVERIRVSTDKLTDFNVGSVLRSILEAASVELDDYYQELYLGLRRAIPTAVYLGFDFDIKPAVAASGLVALTRIDDLSIDIDVPAGTRLVSDTGELYVTNEAVLLAIGQPGATVTASAEVPGAAGNTGAGTLALPTSTSDLSMRVAASNPAIFSGGEDAETEEQRAERFAAFIAALSRGTPQSLEYGATLPAIYHPTTGALIERVQRAAVFETPGYVQLWVHNGSFGASGELVAAVQAQIDGYRGETGWVGGYRPAGMRVDVMVMADIEVDVAIELSASANHDSITQQLETVLASRLRQAVPGAEIRPVDIINIALGLDGVSKATILAPTQTILVTPGTVLSLHDLSVTWT